MGSKDVIPQGSGFVTHQNTIHKYRARTRFPSFEREFIGLKYISINSAGPDNKASIFLLFYLNVTALKIPFGGAHVMTYVL